MSFKVGLTGGIGSGKTQISNQLGVLGVEIIDTDLIAREIVVPGSSALSAIVDHFGSSALTDDKDLNRTWLRNHVFEFPEARAKLDEITHPIIAEITEQRLRECKGLYCVAVVPLLVEASFKKLLDHVVVVTAPIEKRVKWIMNRNQLSRAEVLKMINSQASDTERISQADTTIRNTGNLEQLKLATNKLHLALLDLANQVSKAR
ncbi:MAG: dephospho-CoA kinase [Proteobacteria bacterium]|jgi:dephospho-CoA kinase|nr:dephospho-CoA kinase [Pseudomonadota bacterium]